MNRIISIVPIVLALALTAAACHKNSATTTTTPSPTQTTETFNGTVPVRGSASNNFTVANSGRVDVTLTAASPPATVVMGLGVGTPGDAGCTVLPGASTNTTAGTAGPMSGTGDTRSPSVTIYDAWDQTPGATYTLTLPP